ncbi:unnamed protein product [Microthlaspi erraticum]|uniref:CCHC-type domain-containing protein n=1 Tax=Microthlaspi erraticum TaxID=1685480 RepID=A0A6D2KMG7_9BRAS|nr:unnamed protein product [Microthlaspi erraticum]
MQICSCYPASESAAAAAASSAEAVQVSVLVLAGVVCLRRVRRGAERRLLGLVRFLEVRVTGVGARSIVIRVVPRGSQHRGCAYYCKEPGHIKPMCPKLRSMSVALVQPVAAQPVSQIAAVQLLGQIAPVPRGYSSVETGGTSQTGFICNRIVEVLNAFECVGTLLVGGFESYVCLTRSIELLHYTGACREEWHPE